MKKNKNRSLFMKVKIRIGGFPIISVTGFFISNVNNFSE